MQTFIQEIRFGARQLMRSPGFALVAIATLALGVGVNTAIFSVVEAVMLRPLPYPDPDRLLFFGETNGKFVSVSPADLPDYSRNHTLAGLVSIGDIAMNLTGSGAPERVPGTRVTWNFFDVIGVPPQIGRGFTARDDRFGAPHVVVLGNEFWRSRFGADARILGKSIRLDNASYEVIGIMPPGFVSPEQFTNKNRLEYYVPACFDAETLTDRGTRIDDGITRLKPGATLEQARAEFNTIGARLAKAYPATNAEFRPFLSSARSKLAEDSRTALLVLLGAVGVILLIACANVANLLLSRAAGQRREIAVRIALGAKRTRIIRELLIQTGLLALGGCVLGLLSAAWLNELLIRLEPGSIPRLETAGLNWSVLAFTLLASCGTVLLAGLAPAWLVSGADPQLALHGSGTRHSAGSALLRWRGVLMAGEVALSLVLLVGAGLMLKSFVLLRGVNLGFEPDRVLAMNITIPERAAESAPDPGANHDHDGPSPPPPAAVDPEAIRRLQFFEALTQRVEAIPGVESAAFGRFPLRGHWVSSYLREEDPSEKQSILLDSQMCSIDYFRTLQLPVVVGRGFTAEDRDGSEAVAVVNQSFAHKYYPAGNVIGHRIRRSNAKQWRTIVGVVADAHFYGQDVEIGPAAFLPASQLDAYPLAISDFAVKSALPLSTLLPAVRKAVWSLDPDQPITRIRLLSENVSESQATRRFQMILLLLFGLLALALAIVGIYGVVAYSVGQRTAEIGIRVALGARQASILGMVVRQAMALAGAGVAVGLAAAWAATRSLTSLLYTVKPVDAITYAGVTVLLMAAALSAAWLPARRAARTDPMVALRHE